MKKYGAIIFFVLLVACHHAEYKNPHVIINTTFGDIEVELFPDKAPVTVAAFLSYINAGYYKNSSFYRVQTNENVPPESNTGLIQGGIFKTNSSKLSHIPGIAHESTKQTGLSHKDGTISLARTTPGTASTEFFICIKDQPQFDSDTTSVVDGQGFAAFGRVVSGMDVVRKIQNTPSHGDALDVPVKIETIKKI